MLAIAVGLAPNVMPVKPVAITADSQFRPISRNGEDRDTLRRCPVSPSARLRPA
jgi:hypothetical protein